MSGGATPHCYFPTYEQREKAFRESLFLLTPRKHLGAACFWKDMWQALDGFQNIPESPISFITSNPRDCLAFSTVSQVLRAAKLSTKAVGVQATDVDEVADRFQLTNLLRQPVRTLSGGETIKLALAKSHVLSHCATRLIISSPFCWLANDNRYLFTTVLDNYSRRKIPIGLLALDGENDDTPLDADLAKHDLDSPVGFHMHFRQVRVPLEAAPIYDAAPARYAVIADYDADLVSPCLVRGDNGAGKSLAAAVLANTIPHAGEALIQREGRQGHARLLFQDVIAQTLLRPFDAILNSCPGVKKGSVMALYQEIMLTFAEHFKLRGVKVPLIGYRDDEGPRSLLQMKALLSAVRLCGSPSALILDEPAWGLSKQSAAALVAAIVKVSHETRVPVIVICQRPWWGHVVQATITVSKEATASANSNETAFTVRLTSL